MTVDTASPRLPAAWRGGWIAFGVSALARTALGILVLLLLASTVPALAGWQSSVVMSGSMAPVLETGDLVVVRPADADTLAQGQIVLVDDPDVPGQLRMHRIAAIEAGRLRLRGDANPQPDGTLVDPSAVHGTGVYSLPAIGLPMVWSAQGRALPLAATGAGIVALLGLALLYRAPGGNAHPRASRRRLLPRRRHALAVGAVVVVTAAMPGLSPAGAVFSATTANQADSFTANPYWSCADAAAGSGAPGYLALQETTGPTAVNGGWAGSSVTATYRGGVTYRAAGPTCSQSVTRAVRLDGSSGYLTTNYALDSPQSFTAQIWFATTTTRGGKLVGFGNGPDGVASSQFDRHIYMRNNGLLTFGVYNGGYVTVNSTKAYNDGAWHLATATFSPETGMRLYVDGGLVGQSTSAPAAENYIGYWRVGYDSLSTGWPGAPSSAYFGGSVAHVSVYQVPLPADEVLRQFQAVG
jgi:signal peptidase I